MIKGKCNAFQLRQNVSVLWLTIINVLMLCGKRKYNVKSEKYFTRWTVLDIILVSRSLGSSDRKDKYNFFYKFDPCF